MSPTTSAMLQILSLGTVLSRVTANNTGIASRKPVPSDHARVERETSADGLPMASASSLSPVDESIFVIRSASAASRILRHIRCFRNPR